MARVLVIGDVHIKTNNIPIIDILTEKLVELAKEQKPDIICLLGDMLDTFEKMYIVTQNRCNNLVRSLRKIAPVFITVGNHECLQKGTPVLLYNGTTRLVQNIKKGDVLTGDDNLPRNVLRVFSGKSEMYEIKQSNGMTYTVTPGHKLCLKSRHHRRLTWNETESKCEISWFEDNSLETKIFDSHDGNKRYSKQDLLRISEAYLNYVAPTNVIEMTAQQLYSVLSVDTANNLCGYKIAVTDPTDCTLSELTITKLPGLGKYYGIEVDGNHRFLLGDRTVTHNCCNNQQFLSEEHSLNALKDWENVTVVDTVIPLTLNGAQLVFVPYVPPGRFIEALNTIEDKWKSADCIFAHQELFNCIMGNVNSTEGDKWNIKNPFVCSGHIHLKQRPQSNIYYPGSSTQASFGENEDKIVALLTVEHGKPVDIQEFDLDLPKKKIVHVDVEKLEEYILPENNQDDIKLTVSGSYDQFKALKKTKKYKELEKQGLHVVFKPEKLKKGKDVAPIVDSSVNFNEILANMVTAKKDPYLYQAYEHVVNNNPIEEDSVMFL